MHALVFCRATGAKPSHSIPIFERRSWSPPHHGKALRPDAEHSRPSEPSCTVCTTVDLPSPNEPYSQVLPVPIFVSQHTPHPLLFMQDPFQSFPDRLVSGCVPEHPPPSVSSTSTPPPLFDKPSTKPPCPISTPCASEAHHEHLVITWPPKSHRWSCHVAAAHALLHADVRPRSTLVVLGQPVSLWPEEARSVAAGR